MIITCAIIDDEPLAAGLLESYVAKTPYLSLKGTYNSAIQAMKDLRDDAVNLHWGRTSNNTGGGSSGFALIYRRKRARGPPKERHDPLFFSSSSRACFELRLSS